MIKRFMSALISICIISVGITAGAAQRIPVYNVGGVLYFFDKSSGTITGFAGEPKDITLPSSLAGIAVKAIGKRAFYGCSSITSVNIDGASYIYEDAFASCPNLTSVNIGASVIYIGERAFCDCTGLSKVTFGGTPTTIEPTAFINTKWVSSSDEDFVILGKNTLLKYNGNDETVTVPDGITEISPNAFAYNSNIRNVILPEGVCDIGENAFVHCNALSEINIPSTVSYIGAGAFDDTAWLHDNPSQFVCVNGILIAYKGGEKHIELPESITAIGSGAFMANEMLCSVKIPDSVIYIDSLAFAGCVNLSSVTVSDSVEWIDEYAFSGCTMLTLSGGLGSYASIYAAALDINFSKRVNVKCNSVSVYSDYAPSIIFYERTFVPLRAVMESLGWNVSYNAETGSVRCIKDENVFDVYPDGRFIMNGTLSATIAPPVILNGCTLVSVRVLADSVGADVLWDENTDTVNLLY